jgi:hypothetical protein
MNLYHNRETGRALDLIHDCHTRCEGCGQTKVCSRALSLYAIPARSNRALATPPRITKCPPGVA